MILLALALIGCQAEIGALTPEQAAEQDVARISQDSTLSFQVVGRRQWERGIIVLYTFTGPPSEAGRPTHNFGYSVVEPAAWGTWQATRTASGGSDGPLSPSNYVYALSETGDPNSGAFALVAGCTLSPDVSAVEATFDNGQVMRDNADDGVFVLVARAAAVCELRVLDHDGNLLRQIDLASGNWPGRRVNGCSTLHTTRFRRIDGAVRKDWPVSGRWAWSGLVARRVLGTP